MGAGCSAIDVRPPHDGGGGLAVARANSYRSLSIGHHSGGLEESTGERPNSHSGRARAVKLDPMNRALVNRARRPPLVNVNGSEDGLRSGSSSARSRTGVAIPIPLANNQQNLPKLQYPMSSVRGSRHKRMPSLPSSASSSRFADAGEIFMQATSTPLTTSAQSVRGVDLTGLETPASGPQSEVHVHMLQVPSLRRPSFAVTPLLPSHFANNTRTAQDIASDDAYAAAMAAATAAAANNAAAISAAAAVAAAAAANANSNTSINMLMRSNMHIVQQQQQHQQQQQQHHPHLHPLAHHPSIGPYAPHPSVTQIAQDAHHHRNSSAPLQPILTAPTKNMSLQSSSSGVMVGPPAPFVGPNARPVLGQLPAPSVATARGSQQSDYLSPVSQPMRSMSPSSGFSSIGPPPNAIAMSTALVYTDTNPDYVDYRKQWGEENAREVVRRREQRANNYSRSLLNTPDRSGCTSPLMDGFSPMRVAGLPVFPAAGSVVSPLAMSVASSPRHDALTPEEPLSPFDVADDDGSTIGSGYLVGERTALALLVEDRQPSGVVSPVPGFRVMSLSPVPFELQQSSGTAPVPNRNRLKVSSGALSPAGSPAVMSPRRQSFSNGGALTPGPWPGGSFGGPGPGSGGGPGPGSGAGSGPYGRSPLGPGPGSFTDPQMPAYHMQLHQHQQQLQTAMAIAHSLQQQQQQQPPQTQQPQPQQQQQQQPTQTQPQHIPHRMSTHHHHHRPRSFSQSQSQQSQQSFSPTNGLYGSDSTRSLRSGHFPPYVERERE